MLKDNYAKRRALLASSDWLKLISSSGSISKVAKQCKFIAKNAINDSIQCPKTSGSNFRCSLLSLPPQKKTIELYETLISERQIFPSLRIG